MSWGSSTTREKLEKAKSNAFFVDNSLAFLKEFEPIFYNMVKATYNQYPYSELNAPLISLLSKYKRSNPESEPVLFHLMANPLLKLFDPNFADDEINRYFTVADYKQLFELSPWKQEMLKDLYFSILTLSASLPPPLYLSNII